MDRIYAERRWLGDYEVWTYSDGDRVSLGYMVLPQIERYAKKYGFRVVWVE
jgi:hypothetical protein